MATIDILAIETTGTRDEDQIVEYAMGRYSTGKGLTQIEHKIFTPDLDLEDWEEAALNLHHRSGLLEAMLEEGGKPRRIKFGSSNMRIVWQRAFAKKFIKDQQMQGAHCASGFIRLFELFQGCQITRPSRAPAKVRLIATVLEALEDI